MKYGFDTKIIERRASMTTYEKLTKQLGLTYDKYTIVEFSDVWERAKFVHDKKLYEVNFTLEFTSLFTPTRLRIKRISFIKRVG